MFTEKLFGKRKIDHDSIYPGQREVLQNVILRSSSSYVDEKNRIYILTNQNNTNFIKSFAMGIENNIYDNFCMMDVTVKNKRKMNSYMIPIEEDIVSLPFVGEVVTLRAYTADGQVGRKIGDFIVDDLISEKRRTTGQVILIRQ